MTKCNSLTTVLLLAMLTGCQGLAEVLEVIIASGPVMTGPPSQPPSDPRRQPPPNPDGGGDVPPASLPPAAAIGPSLAELDAMASAMLTRGAPSSGLSGSIVEDTARSGGVAAIGYGGGDSIIYVHPTVRRTWSANTWAFIIGHELSHALLQHRGGPEDEWAADERGATLADGIGYDVSGYIRFICSEQPNSCSRSHGCFHDRMRRLEEQFSVSACESPDDHTGHLAPMGLAALAPAGPERTGPCIIQLPE